MNALQIEQTRDLLKQGFSNVEIAARIGVETGTIESLRGLGAVPQEAPDLSGVTALSSEDLGTAYDALTADQQSKVTWYVQFLASENA